MAYRTSLFCALCKKNVKEKAIIFLPNKLGVCPACYNPNNYKPC